MVQAAVRRERHLRRIPVHQKLVAFARREQGEAADGLVGRAGNRLQQRGEVSAQPLDGRRLEQVGVVFQRTQQTTIGGFRERPGEVKTWPCPWRWVALLEEVVTQAYVTQKVMSME
jgi:hypothetical protein